MQLSELDAHTLHAATRADAGRWQYRLYVTGPNAFLLIRVGDGSAVHEVAGPRELPDRQRAEDLFDRLSETLADDATDDAVTATERRILAEAGNSVPPESRVPSGPLARVRANIAAIRTLRTLRAEDRPPTAAEREVLARWSSWGAVPGIFDPRKPELAGPRAELRALLSDEEWHAAEATTRNAHFTDVSLVQPIWQALRDLGFRDGRVLEPGCGSGNFLAFAPPGARMTGVELDPVTAAIAAALHPDAEVRAESFVATRQPEGYYDAAIGNVPFDEIALTDPVHNPLRLATHNHFIVKALELTRPGGIVAVLTSRYTLDSMGKTARLEIADRADLVGAVRLPAGAHRKNAGTDAITDLLILRRREGPPPAAPPEWVGLAPFEIDADTKVLVNRYFATHPERVLGTIGLTSTAYGREDLTVRPREGEDLADALSRVLVEITGEARESGLTMTPSPDAAQRAAVDARAERMRRAQEMFGAELQRFEGTLLDQGDGTFLQVAGGELADRPVYKTAAAELRALLSLRDTYIELLGAESTGKDDEATELRRRLNQRYDAYTSKFGFLNARESRRDRRSAHGAFRTDPYAAGVYALESYDPDTSTAKKSAIFTRPVSRPRAEQTAETPHDALAISLDTHGKVRLDEIARLLGTESLEKARDVLGDLVFHEPGSQRLIPAAEYVSGNVRVKLERAEEILRMVSDDLRERHPLQRNVAALRQVLPPDKQPGDIEDVEIGATWIEPEYYQQFLQQLLQTRHLKVTRTSGADWEVEAPNHVRTSRTATKVYGTERRNAVELARRMLRRASLVVHPPQPAEDAGPQDIQDGKRWAAGQTEQAIAKADELNRLFADWLWQDAERTTDVLTTYNRLHNSYVPYQGDGAHLTFPGLSDAITPRPHQRAGVARALAEPGGSFFDYEVGFGKTLTIAMTLMEMKRLGTVGKPCVVVKNATVNDFRNDFLKAYPNARVLAIDSSEFTKESAAQYIAQIANGDWDAVILPQSLFKRIPLSGRGQEQFVEAQTAEYRARIHKLLAGGVGDLAAERNPGGDPLISESLALAAEAAGAATPGQVTRDRDTIKKLQGDLKRHTQRAERNLVKSSLAGISWEQTGIDFIAVDEVQDYANGAVGANNSELSLPVSSQAGDLKMKLRTLERAYGAKVGLGSTGTPFPNAMPQAYVMLDYFRPDLLAAAEISAFSSFQAQYLTEVVAPEVSPEGVPRIKVRIGAFRNARQFSQLWQSMADVKTKREIRLPVPEHTSETVVVAATDADRAYMAEIAERAELVRDGYVDATEDNLLKISNDGRQAAMDLRMVGVEPDGPGKLDRAADEIAAIWKANRKRHFTDREGVPSPLPGALQLVFADRGTPSEQARKKERFIAYDYLRDELVRRGVPEEHIRYAQSARTAEEKERLFADCRQGKVAVLIGSTDVMGVGVNVQDRAIALHHLDCPWRPSDVTQREGRILRQFNQHFDLGLSVQIYRWVKAGSFDSFMWQTVERKARFIDQVRTGRELEEQGKALDGDLGKDYLEFGEIKAIATGNPLLLKKIQADEEVRQVEAAFTSWKRTNQHLRTVVDTGDETLAQARDRVDRVQRAAKSRTGTGGDAFRMQLPDGRTVTKRQDAAAALHTELTRMRQRSRRTFNGEWRPLASLGGQRFEARINEGHDHILFAVAGLRDVPQAGFTVDDIEAVLAKGNLPLGLVTRLENQVDRLDTVHTTLVAVVEELKQEIDRARKLVDQPFTKMDRLNRARAEQARIAAEIELQGRREADAEPSTDTEPRPEPYTDRTDYWVAEEAMVTQYRSLAEEHGANLAEGSESERALLVAAQAMLAGSRQARVARLLGLEEMVSGSVIEALAGHARAVAEQWDREQRNPRAVSAAWDLYQAVRDHVARYRVTVENPDSLAFARWKAGEEPITVADEEATEFIAGLSLVQKYTVTGPDGRRLDSASGIDLAPGFAQLVADGTTVEPVQRGFALVTPDGSRYEITLTATVPPGSANQAAHRMAVLLGRYSEAGELAAGRERVAESVTELCEVLETAESDRVGAILGEVEQIQPADVLGRYDRLADAASQLADAAEGEIAERARRLTQRTERHLGRLHATGDDLHDLLLNAAALDTDSWAVLSRNDPLKERPAAYSDSGQLNFARSLIFETYDQWPQAADGAVGQAGHRLRGAMWKIRQSPDTTIGPALTAWTEVVSDALAAAEEVEQPESRNLLRDVAQRAYQHQQSLAARQLAAAGSAPYGPERGFAEGARSVDEAWNAWAETATARYLARNSGTSSHALAQLGEARQAAESAGADDGTLDELTRRTTQLAHTAYALVLSLREDAYREPGDQKSLTRLVRTCYGHAASCHASAGLPEAAAAVRADLAEREERLRAEAVPQGAGKATDIEIEHHIRGTIVRGPTAGPEDGAVRAVLNRHGFRLSADDGHWRLSPRMAWANRRTRVRQLTDELSRLGHPHRLAKPETVIPVGEPYSAKAEAVQDFEAMFAGYWRMQDTHAGRQLVARGRNVRPDSQAVFLALEELRQGPVASNRDPFAHPAADVSRRCTTLARATQTLTANLANEGYRAPVAQRHFRMMTEYATLLASRIDATVQEGGLWDRLFGEPHEKRAEAEAAIAESANPQHAEARGRVVEKERTPVAVSKEASTALTPERLVPEKAALLMARARARGWQVEAKWDDGTYHSPYYELSLKADTDQGARDFTLVWEEKRGRYGYNAAHSTAAHFGRRTAKAGFRPALADVERDVYTLRVVDDAPTAGATEAPPPEGERNRDAGQLALSDTPDRETSPDGPRLTRQHLEALAPYPGDDARLAVLTTLRLPDGEVRGAVLLLRSVQTHDLEDGEPVVHGAQIVPANSLVSSSLDGRYFLSDLLAMADARVPPLATPVPWARVGELVAMEPDEARELLLSGTEPSPASTPPSADGKPSTVVRDDADKIAKSEISRGSVVGHQRKKEEPVSPTAPSVTAGSWSARIKIVTEGRNTYITGTGGSHWAEEAELRTLLKKDQNFSFKNGYWQYRGTITGREAAVEEIRTYLRDRDARGTKPERTPAHPPTPQQQRIGEGDRRAEPTKPVTLSPGKTPAIETAIAHPKPAVNRAMTVLEVGEPEGAKALNETVEESPPVAEPETAREHLNEVAVKLDKGDGQLLPQLLALRDLLNGILAGTDAGPVARKVAPPIVNDTELDTALAVAQESEGIGDAPEWEIIGRLRQAEHALLSAIGSGAGASYVSTEELDRTVRSLTARALSHEAFALARRLEGDGRRDTDAWTTAWQLHRAATMQADRLARNLSADGRIDRVAEVRAAWSRLSARMTTARGTPSKHQILMATGFESVKQRYHAAAEHLGGLTRHPLWRRCAEVFESAQEVFDKARLGAYRLSADDATLGTFGMLWARTVELIAHAARALLVRLDRGGNRDGVRWNTVHLLHHTAEDHLSHLRGHLPPDTNSPLGTYDNPTATAEEQLPVAEGWDRLRRAAEVVTEADVAAPVSLQSRMDVGYSEAGMLLRRLEDLEVVGAPQRGRLREVLARPEEATRIIDEARAAEEEAPRWNPTHEPFRTRWFSEVRAALPAHPTPEGQLSRTEMISLLFQESHRVAQGQSDRQDAGQRANQAMELYLTGRNDEIPALLEGEANTRRPRTEAETPDAGQKASAPARHRHTQQQLHDPQRILAGVSVSRR
ncbi:helicase-related protein [Streptomyces sp. NPDC049881]|uniref:helicase-related protein n=1 Tax=Streptomyces sp. NPDC049881 TaxID=3155778 RepID=UPI00341BA804